jgi:SAM-dependent methyltransferase
MVESAEASDPEPSAESPEAPTSPRNDDKLAATVACDVGLGLVSSAGAPPGSEGLPLGCAEWDCMAIFSLSNGGPFSTSTADRRLDLYFWPQLTCLAYFCTSPRPPFEQIVVSRSFGSALGLLELLSNGPLARVPVTGANSPQLPRIVALPGQQHVPVPLELVDCLLCGGSDHETVIIAPDELTRRGGNFRVVRCRNCKLAFTNPRPNERSRALFYPANYGPHLSPESSGSQRGNWRRLLERAALRRRLGYPPPSRDIRTAVGSLLAGAIFRSRRDRQHWIPFRSPGRLLDFGCGADDFLALMRDYGWQVEGIDLFPQVADRLRRNAGIRAHVGTLPHPDIRPESFDAITMRHSLEHVPFPKDVLKAAEDALRGGGLLVVGVPNFASWGFRHFERHWTGLALPRHLTHFTPATLARIVETTGFRVLSIEQIGRDGRVRKSARIATRAGQPSILRWKALAALVARWTEVTGQADSLRLMAEKI